MGILLGTSEPHGTLLLQKVNLEGRAKRSQGEIVEDLDPPKSRATHDQVVPYIRNLGQPAGVK